MTSDVDRTHGKQYHTQLLTFRGFHQLVLSSFGLCACEQPGMYGLTTFDYADDCPSEKCVCDACRAVRADPVCRWHLVRMQHQPEEPCHDVDSAR